MKQLLLLLCCLPMMCFAEGGAYPLKSVALDSHDKASLQQGAKWFMNYCAGCHSLQYARYKRLGEDIGVTHYDGTVDEALMKDNLIFTGAKIGDTIQVAMPQEDEKSWFGKAPPDLTLVARVRGQDWLYTYFKSFYRDDSKQWGTNNAVFPDVAMPNVFSNVQGIQLPVMVNKTIPFDGSTKVVSVLDHLQLAEEGSMTEQEFDLMAKDLVNFLVYVGEPARNSREFLGVFVLLFVGVFTILAYFLKKEYWKDVH